MQSSYINKNYQAEDKPAVIQLYKNLMEYHSDIIYWWPGPQNNWNNVYCVFYKDLMIAKGQIETINIIPANHSTNATHLIFFNIKLHSKWEDDNELRNLLYKNILERANLMKEKLPSQFPVKLCAGNFASEAKDNAYLESMGFEHFKSLYWMHCDLDNLVPQSTLIIPSIFVKQWDIETRAEELSYLQAEQKIWPDDPTSIEKLLEYKSKPFWKAVTAFYNDEIIGSIMVWKEIQEDIGTIENVFVKPRWRNHGIASHLITEGLHYLKDCNLSKAQLLVETENESALKLYRSLSFETIKEERRYWIDL
ncbi:GNAT family N-acetyltransferase [Oceanobacillus oncorhynchi]|uniref:GNAT family N-acetyltransferase n=1 Tax=Oceanobacillus oncorhynchi TaxID=545501 RepID=UPI0034D3D25E